jgi:hypothetical protein
VAFEGRIKSIKEGICSFKLSLRSSDTIYNNLLKNSTINKENTIMGVKEFVYVIQNHVDLHKL